MRFVCIVLGGSILLACSENKITGRKQLNVVSNETMISLADTQYRAVLQKSKVVSSGSRAALVKKIGSDISAAVTRYYQENGMGNLLKDYKWEYNLIERKEVNAWCMPGGKIAVYTGILPVTRNNNALAAVLGHEIAHALAEHGKERVNQQLLAQGGAMTLQVMLAQKPQLTRDICQQAFGLASELGVILPFSRKQELEADKLGLLFAARAGYDPREAIPLWQRMGALSKGNKPPGFASTHPAEETRVEALKQQMPEAVKRYEGPSKNTDLLINLFMNYWADYTKSFEKTLLEGHYS